MARDSSAAAAVAHVEAAWACRARRAGGVYALVVPGDRVVAVAAVVGHREPADRRSWIDVPARDWVDAADLARAGGCQALLVAGFADSVVFVPQSSVLGPGSTALVCGEDGAPRVRVPRMRMAPVRFESRW